jgi:hypothetical protein
MFLLERLDMSFWMTYEDPSYYDGPYDPEDPYRDPEWEEDSYESPDDERDSVDEPMECDYE